jgi:NTE family protein
MRTDSANRSALVLSGGGAYGAYEVGVIRALLEGRSPSTSGPLDPDVFVGTSVGSFNAAVMAMNKGGANESIAQLQAIWQDRVSDNGDGRGNGVYRIRGNPGDYLDPRIPGSPLAQLQRLFTDTASLGRAALPRMLNLLSPHGKLLDEIKCLIDVSVFLDVDPFCHLVEEFIEPRAIRESGKMLRVTATGWLNGDCQEFDFRRMTDEETWPAIRASAAIPGLFPSVKLWNEVFIDGGVVQNTPIKPAVDEDATEIHVISLNPQMMKLPESHIENTLDIFNRVYTAMLTTMVSEDIESARWVNEGVEVMERVEAGEEVDSDTMQRFARVAGVISRQLRADGKLPSKLTIHRYYPSQCLGDVVGMLNFHRANIDAMIADGYKDACAHDCQANDCVIPAVVQRPAETLAAATTA